MNGNQEETMPIPMEKSTETYTYADVLAWPADERWEIIEGVAFNMTPAPSRDHQEISGNLFFEIKKALKDKCKIYAAPFDVVLCPEEEARENAPNVVQPDISIICDPKKLDDKGCKGSPDFIAEILSISTAKKDLKTKRILYEKYRVPEYWILHPGEHIIMVYKLDKKKKYGEPEIYSSEDTIPLTLGGQTMNINLENLFP